MKILNNKDAFESFFAESFPDGTTFRELRLSIEEVNYIKVNYLNVQVNKKRELEGTDNKHWYNVELLNKKSR